MILILMRYPMPTPQEWKRYSASLESVSSRSEFIKTLCWLDEYDEISVPNIDANTLYITSVAKGFLYWVFSLKGEFNKNALLHFLSLHMSRTPMERYYLDYFNFGY